MDDFPCPCCKTQLYSKCCKPFHEGKSLPPTAEKLMRSRYSAYALNFAEYIIATTHPDNPGFIENQSEWIEEILNFSEHTLFEKLDILDDQEGKNISYVTFKAHLKQNEKDISFIEKSRFKKKQGKWLYLDGTFLLG